MILTCPQCATRYLLPAHMLAPEGRRVKCSSCHEVWFQLPDTEEISSSPGRHFEEIPEGVRPIPDGSNLPTLHEEESSNTGGRARAFGYAASVAVFTAVFAVLLVFQPSVSKNYPFTQAFYAMLGYDAPVVGVSLTFDMLEAKAESDAAGEKISITGKIVNPTEKEERVPMIEAQMQSETGEILERWIIRPPEPVVAAQGDLTFSTSYLIATPGAASNIHLQFVTLPD